MATVLDTTVTVTPDRKQQLRELAQNMGKSEADLVDEALAGYIARETAIVTRLKEGMAAAERGELVDHAEVDAWLKSWGTENERPPPFYKAR